MFQMIPGNATAAASHSTHTGIVCTLAAGVRAGNAFTGSGFAIPGFAYVTAGRIVTLGAVFRTVFNLISARACIDA